MPRAQRLAAIALLAIAVAIATAAAPPPARAFGQNGGTETSTGTAPADGTMITHTDEIPAGATQGSLAVQPLAGTDAHAFDEITAVLVQDFPWIGKTSKRSQATLACVLMSYLPYANKPADQPISFTDVQEQVMLLKVCLQMALSIPASPAAARDSGHGHSAATGCGRLNPAAVIKVTHSSAGYRGVVTGKLHNAKRPRLTVACRRSGRGLLFTVKPRKRGQTLRQAGGPSLAIAYRNPTSAPVAVRTTFTVN